MQYKFEFEETPNDDTNVIESRGVRVFIDMKSALYLAGSEIDYDDGLMGQGFKINNPNATNQCSPSVGLSDPARHNGKGIE